MRKFWFLVLLLDPKYTTGDEKSCANMVCHHDNVQVCGVRGDGSGEVAFRVFRDACALQKYECQEDKINGFNLVNLDYCKQAFSVNNFRRSSINNNDIVDETNEDGVKANEDQQPIDTANSNEHVACIQCSSSSETKYICAIRPEDNHFVIRWFPDECHMRQYNCENHLNFSVTDDYICVGRNDSTAEDSETENLNPIKALSCFQNDCTPDFKEVCAIRPENERFRVRWFDDKCEMLKYNCDNQVNFSVTYDYICVGRNDSKNSTEEDPETENLNPIKALSCFQNDCTPDFEEVCAIRPENERFRVRWFDDKCEMLKYNCDNQVNFSVTDDYICVGRNDSKNSTEEDPETENLNPIKALSCFQNDCTPDFKKVCAIRPENERFRIRWFDDKCEMLKYNCDNQVNFSVTDDYICVGRNDSKNSTEEDPETENLNPTKALSCFQNDCTPDFKEVCAIRPENERFRIRWFDDKCEMLKYNCDNHVNFSVTDDFICIGNDSSDKAYKNPFETQTNVRNIRELQGIAEEIAEGVMEKDLTIKGAEGYDFKDKLNHMKSRMPNKVVVSTFDLTTESLNQTVKKIFAASHSTGIELQKLGDEETRRMTIKNTGPVNVYRPKTIRPAGFVPLDHRNITEEEKKKLAPLLKYCFHKCPERCPEIYKPVCLGRGGDVSKLPSYISVKNHCYMDMAKCMTEPFKNHNATENLEEVAFIFCGGLKIHNMVYMFPMIRILQRMGRLKKAKGKARFLMRDLGYFPARMQG